MIGKEAREWGQDEGKPEHGISFMNGDYAKIAEGFGAPVARGLWRWPAPFII
jgi:hypothetical protein